MVGEKRSSHIITEEYAKADPVYIAKTIVSLLFLYMDDKMLKLPGFTTAVFFLQTGCGRWELRLERYVVARSKAPCLLPAILLMNSCSHCSLLV